MSNGNTVTQLYTIDGVYAPLAERYGAVLAKAKQFLGNQRVSRSGGSASESRKTALLEAEADCPQCGLRFVGKNHNTEHIHPKSLGGGKGDRENRIQMCRMCNNARGSTMTAFIGTPPFSKHYPNNWSKIEAFLLWSELTIDDGLEAGAQIPEVHELFIEARFAGAKPLGAKPVRAFGRFSTWSAGDEPNYPHNSTRPISTHLYQATSNHAASKEGFARGARASNPTVSLKSMFARMARDMFDRLFDYEPVKEENSTGALTDLDATDSISVVPEVGIDKHALLDQWKAFVDLQIWSNNGEMMLGDFWNLVADAKTAKGCGWREFERSLDLSHKMAMPGKASQLLQHMGYVFSFQKTEDEGYKVIFNSEEE